MPRAVLGFSPSATRDLIAHYESEIQRLRTLVTELESSVERRDEEIGRLSSAGTEFDQRQRQLERQQQELERQRAEAERQREELRERVASLEEELERRGQEVQELRDGILASASRGELAIRDTSEIVTKIVAEELAPILAAAEEAAARIVERARSTSDLRVRRADVLMERLQTQNERLHRWWERIEPAFRGMQSKLDELSAVVDDVPRRIQAALLPLSDSVTAVKADLEEASGVAEPPSPSLPVDVRPVTMAQWPDLERLFGPEGGFGGCWCMQWRLEPDRWMAQLGEANRQAMQDLIQSDRVPGLLGYVDGEPAAWCSVGPREDFPALETIPGVPAPEGEGPVWSVVCFFVAEPFRDRGLMKPLLDAAVRYAADHGAALVEAYPVQPTRELSPPLGVTGVASAFHRAGFVEVARPSEHQSVMRLFLDRRVEQPAET